MRFLLLTCSLVLCNWAHAQYLPTIEENKIWSVSGYYVPFEFRSMYDIYIDGEELYEEQEYKVLRISSEVLYQRIFGLIREDTATGKVWFRSYLHTDINEHIATSEEVLIADYSLEPGDQFYYKYFIYNWDDEFFTDSVLYQVEEVGVLSGRKYLQMNSLDEEQQNFFMNYDFFFPFFDYPAANQIPLRFIEGIGPSFGLTSQNSSGVTLEYPLDPYLLCAHIDGEEVWNDPFVEGCAYEGELPFITSIENHNYDFDFVAFPNPTSSHIRLQLPQEFAARVEFTVYNITGQVVSRHENFNAQHPLPMPHPPGLYVVEARSDGNVGRGKVVVE